MLMAIEGGERRSRLRIQPYEIPARQNLSKKDARLLNTTERALRAFAGVYAAQEDDRYPGANFYPPDASREQILEAAAKNPAILSPYTVVRRDRRGELYAIPYHEAYKDEVKPVVALMRDASHITDDIPQSRYLLAVAGALDRGEHELAAKEWLGIGSEPTIDVLLGYYDRYTDKLLGRKFAAEGWTGILNHPATEHAQIVVDEIINFWMQEETQKVGVKRPRMKVRIDQTTLTAGQAARYDWVANNLPCQQNWRRKYGNKFTILQPNFEEKTIYERYPMLKRLVETERLPDFTPDEILHKALVYYFGHEVSHALTRRIGDEERLGSSFATFSELICITRGLEFMNKLERLTDSDKNLILSMHFAATVAEIQASRRGNRMEYATAHKIIFNYLYEQGAISLKDGFVHWQNPDHILFPLTGFVGKLDNFATNLGEADFQLLIDEYGSGRLVGQLNPLKLPSVN